VEREIITERVQFRLVSGIHGFHVRDGVLACDGVSLAEIALAVGTPVHVYSAALIRDRARALDAAFASYPHESHYAIKANATLGICRLMREAGLHADANSGGEIEVALRAGFTPAQIVFTGVGKSRAELELAVRLGVKAINAESPGEVDRIEAIAAAQGTCARVAVRINPDVDAESHRHISTGHHGTKFGMSVPAAREMVRTVMHRPHLQIVGLHAHIGSQITKTKPVARVAETISSLAAELLAEGVPLKHLDLGGGLGIAYRSGDPTLEPSEYAAALLPAVRATGLTLVLEPGRWLVGPAGVLLASVVDLKPQTASRWFVVVDAGMVDLIRPALYSAWHGIEPVAARAGAPMQADIVGPVCETTDTLGEDRTLPPVEVGDLLAVRDTGAYGAVMASNYNRRPIAAEVLVDDGRWTVIRRRQTIDDMLQWDA
jgi:diaminopimelate decarboxylase